MKGGLLAANPAAHLVWWVALAAFALLGLIVLLDALRTLRYWWSERHAPPPPEPAREEDRFRLGGAPGPFLRRFHRSFHTAARAPWRTWREGRVNELPAGDEPRGRRWGS